MRSVFDMAVNFDEFTDTNKEKDYMDDTTTRAYITISQVSLHAVSLHFPLLTSRFSRPGCQRKASSVAETGRNNPLKKISLLFEGVW